MLNYSNWLFSTRHSLREYRQKSEIIVAWSKVAVIGFISLLFVSAPMPSDTANVEVYPYILFSYLGLLAVTALYVSLTVPSRWVVWGSIIVDFAALYSIIWTIHVHYGQPASFYLKTPSFVYIFVFIALRTLRFEAKYVLGAGAAAIIGWLALAVFARWSEGPDVVTTSFVEYMTASSVLWGAEVEKMVIIAFTTVILAFGANRARSLLFHQISISEDLDRKTKELAETFVTDQITGLPNRNAFEQDYKELAVSSNQPAGLAMIDIVDLDRRLATFGANFTDQIIRQVQTDLTRRLKDGGRLYRFGDSTFLILSRERVTKSDLVRFADEVVEFFDHPIRIDGREIVQPVQIGLFICDGSLNADEALSRARSALTFAEADNHTSVSIYDDDMRRSATRFAALESAMRVALEKNQEFVPHYQPIMSAETTQLAGFESLGRWVQPSGDIVSPVEFIPVAEATGMIVPLGYHYFEQSCRDIASFNAHASEDHCVFMSINVSVRQFQEPDFVARVDEILDATDCKSGWIKIEITESVAANDIDAVMQKIRDLRDRGIRVAIDDFGTGYSSLSYISSLPVTTLKVDQSFVRDICETPANQRVVRTIVDIAKSFDLELIAEGIEDEETRDFLNGIGIDMLQGYLFSKPLPFGEIREKYALPRVA